VVGLEIKMKFRKKTNNTLHASPPLIHEPYDPQEKIPVFCIQWKNLIIKDGLKINVIFL